MNPTPEQLRLCAYLMENPEVPWQWKFPHDDMWWSVFAGIPFECLQDGKEIRLSPDAPTTTSKSPPKFSREGKRLLILHNQDCDQFGDITGESPSHLWFTRHGGYFKLNKESGEVETLKPSEF